MAQAAVGPHAIEARITNLLGGGRGAFVARSGTAAKLTGGLRGFKQREGAWNGRSSSQDAKLEGVGIVVNRAPGQLAALLVGAVLAGPPGVGAQVLFDWPVRSAAAPEALLTGAPALLWNPAGAAPTQHRDPQLWVVHIDGPDASGLQGLAAAAAFDVPVAGRIGVTYQHLGVPDIPRTTDSPEPEPGTLTVTEDLAVLSMAGGLTERGALGASLRVMRGTVGSDRRTRVSVDVGARTRLGGRATPGVGLVLRSVGTRTEGLFGVDAGLPLPWDRLSLRGGYGLQAPLSSVEPTHEISLRGRWEERLVFGAAALSHPDASWTGLFEFRLEIGRYSLAVVREGLPNAFGAAHFFQMTIDFGPP